MIDLDYGPGVFSAVIIVVFILPALYGVFFVDTYWKKHQQENVSDDPFN